MEIALFAMAAVLVLPGVPFVVAAVLTWRARNRWDRLGPRRRLAVAIPAALWWMFIAYELTHGLWAEPDMLPIRFDLLLIAPVLMAAAIVALVAGRGARSEHSKPGSPPNPGSPRSTD